MSHSEQRRFFKRVRQRFPEAFTRVGVLDCGSLNVNGTLRDLFTDSDYCGVDIRPGPNVDYVSRIHELPFAAGAFDTVVSAEMLEHDEYWRESLQAMYEMLRGGGLLAISAAGTGRKEHGTQRATDGNRLYGTSPDYYRNLTRADILTAFDGQMDAHFSFWRIGGDTGHADIYFVGRKR
jgi:SAM-dependent methyltransferase